MGFSRQEYWSGLPFPHPGDLSDPGIEFTSCALAAGFFTTELPGKTVLGSVVVQTLSCAWLCKLATSVQQNESAVHIHTSALFWISISFRTLEHINRVPCAMQYLPISYLFYSWYQEYMCVDWHIYTIERGASSELFAILRKKVTLWGATPTESARALAIKASDCRKWKAYVTSCTPLISCTKTVIFESVFLRSYYTRKVKTLK